MGILVQGNGLCALVDSHVYGNTGAIILMANSPNSLTTAYSRMLHDQNVDLTTYIHLLKLPLQGFSATIY